MVEVITDADVQRLPTPSRAIAWMREALVAEHRGGLRSPPRVHADLGDGRLAFFGRTRSELRLVADER